MNEQEWLDCADPNSMLESIRDKVGDRRLRLFACACCRSIWRLFKEKHAVRMALAFAEKFADGQATKNELHGNAWGKTSEFGGIVMRKALDAAKCSAEHASGLTEQAVRESDPSTHQAWNLAFDAAWKDQGCRLSEAMQLADAAAPLEWLENARLAGLREQQKQTAILRDIFGNPFRPVAIDPAWLTPKVTTLSQAIYEERRVADMPVLADTLEEAGCNDADILNHCRQPGEHVLGCWVVDLLLGKS